MRLKSICAKDVPPVGLFEIDDLADVIVLAGPNGVGKTRLVQSLLQYFQNPTPSKNWRLEVMATTDQERRDWGKPLLNTADTSDCQKFRTTLQKNRRRANWVGSVLNFESDRTIQKVSPYSFTWDNPDPEAEDISWNTTFTGLASRHQDTLNSIFRKIQHRRDKIARKAESLIENGQKQMDITTYPDPAEAFKTAFHQLLGPKELLSPDPQKQQLYYRFDGKEFPFSSLSSGEREVTNIVFDFILRQPSNCIVIFDEPELHLHPELSYKLLQALRAVGDRNQFVFCTHSPDIISASLDNTVVFLTPPKGAGINQAAVVKEDDSTYQALRLLGQSIGIISLGKKIVLIEGTNASLDKKVYGSILSGKYPELILVPSGGRGLITSFASVVENVLERTIWGVDFFMLCDQDAVPLSRSLEEIELAGKGRLRLLKRYHLENHFLDEHIWASVFSDFVPDGEWLRDPAEIRKVFRECAASMLPYAVALVASAEIRDKVGNVDIMPKGCNGISVDELVKLMIEKAAAERTRVGTGLAVDQIEAVVRSVATRIQKCIDEDSDLWKASIPGRPLLNIFASRSAMKTDHLKHAYIAKARVAAVNPFQDIVDIFDGFACVPPISAVSQAIESAP